MKAIEVAIHEQTESALCYGLHRGGYKFLIWKDSTPNQVKIQVNWCEIYGLWGPIKVYAMTNTVGER